MLTPADIAAKQFTVARLGKGYDQVEVDDFLDQLTEDYTQALRQIDDLTRRLDVQSKAASDAALAPTQVLPALTSQGTVSAASGGPSLASIQLLLENAQKTADQLESDAKNRADQTTATAQYQANQIVGKANVDAQDIVKKAQAQADAIQTKISELQNVHAAVAGTLQDALSRLQPAGGTS